MQSAAEDWGGNVSELTTNNGLLMHKASGRSARYSTFAAVAGTKQPPSEPKLKTPDQFKIMGEDVPRLIPSKVDGSAMFGIDASVEGMKIATINASPVFGGTVVTMDASAAMKMPGVVDVVNLNDAIAVVADGYWQVKQALASIDITWSKTDSDAINSDKVFAQFQSDIKRAVENGDAKSDVNLGDTSKAMNGARQVIERSYQVPYLAHACFARQDPYQFRRDLLKDQTRHREILDLVAKKSNWDKPIGKNRGRGIALQESFGTLVTQVRPILSIAMNPGVALVNPVHRAPHLRWRMQFLLPQVPACVSYQYPNMSSTSISWKRTRSDS
ncbi:MAG TPA: hypothetical protein EYQ14_02600 [Gammaproteobacteria bacterium]|nr:hypothetical protein [Gammaproteobacteria bacterium]HIL94956.1 hypothetical protein [Pseudomonadales bacterium]